MFNQCCICYFTEEILYKYIWYETINSYLHCKIFYLPKTLAISSYECLILDGSGDDNPGSNQGIFRVCQNNMNDISLGCCAGCIKTVIYITYIISIFDMSK